MELVPGIGLKIAFPPPGVRRAATAIAAALSTFFIAGPSAAHGGEPGPARVLEFVRHGEPIPLSSDLARRVIRQLETIGRTCALNSRQHDYLALEDELAVAREKILSDSFLRVSYDAPVSLLRGIEITELLQATPDGSFVGHLLTKNGPEIIAYAKCGGLETLQLMCLEGLAGHFPVEYGRNCHIVKKAIEDGQIQP